MARSLLLDGNIVLSKLAEEGRTILSSWRAQLYLRRERDPYYPSDRVVRVLKRLDDQELIEPLEGADGVKHPLYQVTSPYAPKELNPYEAVTEAYYAAALCYGTALEIHRLSEQRSHTLHLFTPRSPSGNVSRRPSPLRGRRAMFRLLRSHGRTHHWELVGEAGEPLAYSGNAYARQEDDLKAISAFRKYAPGAPVHEVSRKEGRREREAAIGAAYELYRAEDGLLHWEFQSATGEVVAIGSQGYTSEDAVVKAIERIREAAQSAPTEEDMEVASLLPLGTSPEDWRLEPLPNFVRLTEVGTYEVNTHNIKPAWLFGLETGEIRGAPIRVTDLERTLLDGLRYPKHCGGLGEVFRAWVRALEGRSQTQTVDVDRVVDYAERIDQLILYQRLGFVMETLGISHRRLGSWKEDKVVRGGSRVLDPDKPYSPDYSEAWGISINYPVTILAERDASYS